MLSYHTSSAATLAEIKEVEHHIHNVERWLELASAPSGETHRADRIGTGAGVFIIDAGNNDWSAWLQVFGSSDTPVDTGMTIFDAHRILIKTAERQNTENILQIACGEDADAALTTFDYTEFGFLVPANARSTPVEVKFDRQAVGTKVWVRAKVPGQNTGSISFFLGLHEYEV